MPATRLGATSSEWHSEECLGAVRGSLMEAIGVSGLKGGWVCAGTMLAADSVQAESQRAGAMGTPGLQVSAQWDGPLGVAAVPREHVG